MKRACVLFAALALSAGALGQVEIQKILGPASGGQFGISVAIDGDTAIIGAQNETTTYSGDGAAYVYVWNGTAWVQQAKLTAPTPQAGAYFGAAVAISGDSVVIGAPWYDFGGTDTGGAFVFNRVGTTWTYESALCGYCIAGDRAGTSVAISGSKVLVGTPFSDLNSITDSGLVYMCVRISYANWGFDLMYAADGAAGDYFGYWVALSGDTAIVGAPFASVGSNGDQGAAYIFTGSGSMYQQAKLTASDGATSDYFGVRAALDGNTAVIGATAADIGSNPNQGAAYVFTRSGTTWTQQSKLTASDGAADDNFGLGAALDGDTVLIGASMKNAPATDQGAVYAFTRNGTSWTQLARLTASDGAADDRFGGAVALSGRTALIGAFGVSYPRGAAYVFGICSPSLDLVATDTCINGVESLVVNIDLADYGASCPEIIGGQFFLSYDNTKLAFVDAVPGGGNISREIYQSHDAGAGTIDYASGAPVGDPNNGITSGPMATLTFTRLADACATANLVTFRTNTPPTRLTDVNNANYDVPAGTLAVNNLGVVTLDATAPTATQGTIAACYPSAAAAEAAAVAATTAIFDLCDASPTVTVATAGTCSATVTVTITDDCGNATSFPYTTSVQVAPVITCPSNLTLTAGSNGCNPTDPGNATATDDCDATPTITWDRSDQNPDTDLDADFCLGTTTITWTATDDCGYSSQCVQTILVQYSGELLVTVELEGSILAGPFNRCITFDICNTGGADIVVNQVMAFTNGVASATIPITPGYYNCIQARDKLHTLRKTDENFGLVGLQYVANFTQANNNNDLVSGNANDDAYIDIIDFGLWATRYTVNYGTPDTTCSTPFYHLDFNGDGLVDELDYSFVAINFLKWQETGCCSIPLPDGGPITRISIFDLIGRGLGELVLMDLNGDGYLDTTDMQLWLEGVRPYQPAEEKEVSGDSEKAAAAD